MAGKIKIIGLTGSLASGKSTAGEILARLGAKIIDADVLAREAVTPGTKELLKIIETFGSGVVTASGELDRKKLAEIVFSNPIKRKSLEEILHPKIRELFLKRLSEIDRLDATPAKVVVYVVPLLFESKNIYPELDATVLIAAPNELCLERAMKRTGYSRELAEKILDSQMPAAAKRRLVDIVIDNDSTREILEERIRKFFESL